MDKVVVIGGGGHAKVVIDVIQSAAMYELVGFVDKTSQQDRLCDIPYLGDDSQLSALIQEGVTKFIVAIGDNKLRKFLYEKVHDIGYTPVNAISPFARISPYAKIGKGVVIMHGAVVNPYAIIEDNVIVNTLAGVEHDCVIGSHAHIAPGCSLAGGVRVGEGTFIGIGTSVVPDVNIGDWAVIGAGAAVITDIDSKLTAVGVPAKNTDKKDG